MGLLEPENEDEARVLVTTIIAGMATGAIPQLDWSHTDDNGVINERGRRHAATIAVGAFAIADAIVAEGERRVAAAEQAAVEKGLDPPDEDGSPYGPSYDEPSVLGAGVGALDKIGTEAGEIDQLLK